MNKGITEIQKQLGKNIAAARKAAGLTQEVLAELIEVQTFSISRIERGSVAPSLSTISKIAKVLNIPVSSLFLVSNTPKAIAQNITDLLTTLSENHQIFIYDQVRQWCNILYQTQIVSEKANKDLLESTKRYPAVPVHYNNVPVSLDMAVHQPQTEYMKDKIESSDDK